MLDRFHEETDFQTQTSRIESICACLCSRVISQTWSYRGIPFDVGRPELVATDPAYRRRGLVRRQFQVIDELHQVYPDCGGIPEACAVLQTGMARE